MNSTLNQYSYRIARRAGHQGAPPSIGNQVGVEKHATATRITKHNLRTSKSITKVSCFNVRTLSNDKNIYELTGLAESYYISVICIQEHCIYHPDIEMKHQMVSKGWLLVTCSAEKNTRNASIGGVGMLISPQAYKYLIKIEKSALESFKPHLMAIQKQQ